MIKREDIAISARIANQGDQAANHDGSGDKSPAYHAAFQVAPCIISKQENTYGAAQKA
jgi:hypothetical protein